MKKTSLYMGILLVISLLTTACGRPVVVTEAPAIAPPIEPTTDLKGRGELVLQFLSGYGGQDFSEGDVDSLLGELNLSVIEEGVYDGPFTTEDGQTIYQVLFYLVDTKGADPVEMADVINTKIWWQEITAVPNFITGEQQPAGAETLLNLAIAAKVQTMGQSGWDCFTDCLGIENEAVKNCVAGCSAICLSSPPSCPTCILGCGGIAYYKIIKCIWSCL
jgi:hypothetical protein